MEISLRSVKLHDTAFIAGTNLGLDLDIMKRRGLQLLYIEETGIECVYIKFNQKIKRIPITNVREMEAVDSDEWCITFPEYKAPRAPTATTVVPQPAKAQVSTPMDHVFANSAGQTGQRKQ